MIRLLSFCVALCVGAGFARSQEVLIIYDLNNASLETFVSALTADGLSVTVSPTTETQYDGTNPTLEKFDAVIHLNGESYGTEMPAAGQAALLQFVQDGGLYIGNEWNAFEISQGRMQTMLELVLLNRVDGSAGGSLALTPAPGTESHPLVSELGPIATTCQHNVGTVRTFSDNPAEVLYTSGTNDALVARSIGDGRAVHFFCALNYVDASLADPEIQRLYTALVRWGSGATREGHHHACLSQNGNVKCWGANGYGQLGLGDHDARGDAPNEMGANLPTVDLGTFEVDRVFTAGSSSCALSSSGKLKCWGRNHRGQLGLGDIVDRGAEPTHMGQALPELDLGGTVADLAMGATHSCALMDSGAVKCWGANEHGQLGLGDSDTRGDQPADMGAALPAVDLGTVSEVVKLSVGDEHSCALFANGWVKCWGRNQEGQLGRGHSASLGADIYHMGDFLPPVPLAKGNVDDLVSGAVHNCVHFDSNRVQCWGGNARGQLGLGDTASRGSLPNQMGAQLPLIDLGMPATAIAAGAGHNCVILINNALKCWGANKEGQLGLGDQNDRGIAPGQMGENLDIVNTGNLSVVSDLRLFDQHTCARLDKGWKCWGWNSAGELGLGHQDATGSGPETMPEQSPFIELF